MTVVASPRPVRRRTKGEQTRNQILHAAIEVLATQGIKATTHRAIANHAQLQLSLTTYYFKDIQELIHQAFILNCAQITTRANTAWLPAFEMLAKYKKAQLKKLAIRAELAELLTTMATQYLIDNIQNNAVELAVKRLLFTEIQSSPQLRELANSHRDALLAPCIQLCHYFNQETADIDADIMLTLFSQIEYRNIVIPQQDVDNSAIYAMVKRLIYWLLQVKQ
ncbi:TetR family transcriptional regulator [Thalassotalea insulae]|uniref:TetR family transcriptional regulator n=1 Tax=Thalassotalea insulae TaxID=2056778 RepID=A0ABQ6GVZ0_9GAMM|nr:TetR family transcriptional regulator [Thalassotalea insulae]GLX80088.1 TetR family transcriptional regulator [Thalassotalea insulae]